jgi:hypothetical protein
MKETGLFVEQLLSQLRISNDGLADKCARSAQVANDSDRSSHDHRYESYHRETRASKRWRIMEYNEGGGRVTLDISDGQV